LIFGCPVEAGGVSSCARPLSMRAAIR
jgi:hypothetical protein